MRWWTWALIGYSVYRLTSGRDPVRDVLMRAFATDHIVDPSADGVSEQVAGQVGIPAGWVQKLRDLGVPVDKLQAAALAALDAVRERLPPDWSPATLAAYRDAVLAKAAQAVGVPVGHAAQSGEGQP